MKITNSKTSLLLCVFSLISILWVNNCQAKTSLFNLKVITAFLECGDDLVSILKTKKLIEGENIICNIKGTKSKLVAIVRGNKLVKWQTINEKGEVRDSDWNYTDSKAAKGKKKKPDLTVSLGDVIEISLSACSTISGTLPDGTTYTLTICKPS